jgi:hypothetical protein
MAWRDGTRSMRSVREKEGRGRERGSSADGVGSGVFFRQTDHGVRWGWRGRPGEREEKVEL